MSDPIPYHEDLLPDRLAYEFQKIVREMTLKELLQLLKPKYRKLVVEAGLDREALLCCILRGKPDYSRGCSV